jgi:hypothetical protein
MSAVPVRLPSKYLCSNELNPSGSDGSGNHRPGLLIGRPSPFVLRRRGGTNDAQLPIAVLKKTGGRRSDRRKNDEDIAERMTGGVRVERPAVRREEALPTPNDQPHINAGDGQSRERRRTP